jgi:septum formation protein
LRELHIPFRVRVSRYEEAHHHGDPRALAEENAAGKAREVAARARVGPGELVLGVDTVVVLDGRVYGKASSADEARAYLLALAGRTHEVWSGLCLAGDGHEERRHDTTLVTFRELDAVAVDAYVASGEWCERAGAYAIQGIGSALVRAIEGDYWNVVGLPVDALVDALAAFAIAPFSWL